jgi:hypothetical protein
VKKPSDVERVMAILNEIDPEGLIKIGAPRDEYEQEASILLDRLFHKPLTPEYVRDVWLVQFGSGEVMETRRGRHRPRIRVHVRDMPMREGFAAIADRLNAEFGLSTPTEYEWP